MLSSPSTVSSALPEPDELDEDEEEEEEEEPPFSQMMKEFCQQQTRGRTLEAEKEVADERETKRARTEPTSSFTDSNTTPLQIPSTFPITPGHSDPLPQTPPTAQPEPALSSSAQAVALMPSSQVTVDALDAKIAKFEAIANERQREWNLRIMAANDMEDEVGNAKQFYEQLLEQQKKLADEVQESHRIMAAARRDVFKYKTMKEEWESLAKRMREIEGEVKEEGAAQ